MMHDGFVNFHSRGRDLVCCKCLRHTLLAFACRLLRGSRQRKRQKTAGFMNADRGS